MSNTPVLYSYDQCPYCLRARLALKYAKQKIILRGVELDNLPAEARAVSSHATVPSLVFGDNEYLDESWDIVKWALQQQDPDNWLGKDSEYLQEAEMLVEINDHSFKDDLEHYKKQPGEAEHPRDYYRQRGEEFLEELNDMLEDNSFLLASHITVGDIAVLPFIRKFAAVDKDWFDKAPYPKLQQWLAAMTATKLFKETDIQHQIWHPGEEDVYL